MRAHYLQHVKFEGLGSIESWLRSVNAKVTCTRFFKGEDLPDLGEIDLLIIMGGPFSVNDEEEFLWLKAEKLFIKDAIKRKIPILGICLGAQLIASALGKKVYRNSEKEIGWFPIKSVDRTSTGELFQFPKEMTVFHWHGETFDLPDDAMLLATSKGCKNQAFQLGRNVLGFQFHLEATPATVREMIDNCRDELLDAPYIQSESDMMSDSESFYKPSNSLVSDALDFLVGKFLQSR